MFKSEFHSRINKIWEMRDNGELNIVIQKARKELLLDLGLYGKKDLYETTEIEDDVFMLMEHGNLTCDACGEKLKYSDGDIISLATYEEPEEYSDPKMYCVNSDCKKFRRR